MTRYQEMAVKMGGYLIDEGYIDAGNYLLGVISNDDDVRADRAAMSDREREIFDQLVRNLGEESAREEAPGDQAGITGQAWEETGAAGIPGAGVGPDWDVAIGHARDSEGTAPPKKSGGGAVLAFGTIALLIYLARR